MNHPEGFSKDGPNGERWVCKLKKGLYGLKQAGRLWYQKLGETLEKIGFKQINANPSVYIWMFKDLRVILPVFVEDPQVSVQLTQTLEGSTSIRQLPVDGFVEKLQVDNEHHFFNEIDGVR